MIPPEPGPDPPTPPEPTVPKYTYNYHTTINIDSTTGEYYGTIQNEDAANCFVKVEISGSRSNLPYIIVNYVPAFDETNYYFCNYNRDICLLASNASIGGTHPYYSYTNGSMVQIGNLDVVSSTPSDYFDDIKSGNFELEERS